MGKSTTDGPTVVFQESDFRVVRPATPEGKAKPEQPLIFEHQIGFDAMNSPTWLRLQPLVGFLWLAKLLGPERTTSELLEREGIRLAPNAW